jgi:hypothetical protein
VLACADSVVLTLKFECRANPLAVVRNPVVLAFNYQLQFVAADIFTYYHSDYICSATFLGIFCGGVPKF